MADPVRLVRRAHAPADAPDLAARLIRGLGEDTFAHVYLFVSDSADFPAIVAATRTAFGPARVSACTTAGELAPGGFCEGSVLAVGLPASHFAVRAVFVEDLRALDQQELVGSFIRHRNDLARRHSGWMHEFAFTLIDGLTKREETLMHALGPGLGGMPLFGGSAGDGVHFANTRVAHDGHIASDAAVVSVIRTVCPVKVFSLDHFEPTVQRMVVTRADPERRIVHEINGEPAAEEYARIVGVPPDRLDDRIFATNPVVVRVGSAHHVRAIMERGAANDLVFASAIDEGMVLILARPTDIGAHLHDNLGALARPTPPDTILACDCLWRRIEIADRQATRDISALLSRHGVIGFTSYGEQVDGLHVNHTMTGVAIYAPKHSASS